MLGQFILLSKIQKSRKFGKTSFNLSVYIHETVYIHQNIVLFILTINTAFGVLQFDLVY
jgi:hypothetical protein